MRKKKTPNKVFFADFETTQQDEHGRVFVYLWAIVSGEEVYTGRDIESFMETVRGFKAILYFHNLKFDFSYIHHYLLTHGIEAKILEKKGTFYSIKFYDVELRDTLNFFPCMTVEDVGKNYNTK